MLGYSDLGNLRIIIVLRTATTAAPIHERPRNVRLTQNVFYKSDTVPPKYRPDSILAKAGGHQNQNRRHREPMRNHNYRPLSEAPLFAFVHHTHPVKGPEP